MILYNMTLVFLYNAVKNEKKKESSHMTNRDCLQKITIYNFRIVRWVIKLFCYP